MTTPANTDEALYDRFAKANDRDAASALIERYQKQVFDFAFRIVRDEADAADAVQSAFLEVLRFAARFRAASSFKTYLYRIVYNKAIDVLRARRRRAEVERSIQSEDFVYSQSNANNLQLIHSLDSAIQSLPEIYRLPILLHYQRGMSYDEVAAVVGCAPGTVGSRLSVAREKMKESLASLGAISILPGWEGMLQNLPQATPPADLGARLQMLIHTTAPISTTAGAGILAWSGAGIAAAVVVATVVFASPKPDSHLVHNNNVSLLSTAQDPPAPSGTQNPPRSPVVVPSASVPAPFRNVKRQAEAERNAAQEYKFKITGRVVNSATGAGAPGVTAYLSQIWPPDPAIQQKGDDIPYSTKSASDGTFTIERGASGTVIMKLFAYYEDRNQISTPLPVFEVNAAREEKVNLTMGSALSDPEFKKGQAPSDRVLIEKLTKAFARDGKATITGSIQREGGGELPEDLIVRLIDSDGDQAPTPLYLDQETGRYLMGPMPAGAVRIEVISSSQGYAVAPRVEVYDAKETAGVVLTMRTGNAKFSGTVVDIDGKPVENAVITIYPELIEDAGLWVPAAGTYTTKKDGRFEINNAGPENDFYRLSAVFHSLRNVKLTNLAADGSELKIVLKPKPKVRGKLILKSTGKPPSGFIHIRASEVRPKIRYKGSFQTMEQNAQYDARTGIFVDEVGQPGPVTLRIDMFGKFEKVIEKLDVPEEGLDVGTIEIDDRK